MRHQRHAEPVRRLDRDVDRGDAARPAGDPADPHLDADDDVAMLAGAGHRLARVAQADIAAFADHDVAREAEDAGEGDVEIGEDPRRERSMTWLAEAGEIAGAGAARIDEGGGAAAPSRWHRHRRPATCRPNRRACAGRSGRGRRSARRRRPPGGPSPRRGPSPTAAILPSRKATSAIRSSPLPGSSTRPPAITRSNKRPSLWRNAKTFSLFTRRDSRAYNTYTPSGFGEEIAVRSGADRNRIGGRRAGTIGLPGRISRFFPRQPACDRT